MKKIMLFMFILVLLVGTVSAFEFDNVKNYDERTRTVEIRNSILGIPFLQLGKVAEIKLNTPINYHVGYGKYEKVAEFQVTSFSDYNNAFKELELFDKKKGNEKFVRDFDFKVLTYETETIYYNKSINIDNKTIGYERKSYNQTKEVWDKLTLTDFKKDDVLTIGIFTFVEKGDHVEWIPNFFGVRIDEWASWTANLNVGLVSYLALNESTGTIASDSTGNGNSGNAFGIVDGDWVTGKIGNAIGFDGDVGNENITYEKLQASLTGADEFSISFWMNITDFSESGQVIFGAPLTTGGNPNFRFRVDSTTSTEIFIRSTGGDGICEIGASDMDDGFTFIVNTWHNIIFRVNTSQVTMWIDGVEKVTRTCSASGTWANIVGINASLGDFADTNAHVTGLIDEVGIWDRSLSDSEIADLYNGGDGITFKTVSAPTITLNFPIESFNSSIQTINFNGTVTSPVNVSLFIDGVLNETNTSAISGDYLFTKTILDGDHNWTYESCNNDLCTTATTRNFTIDTSPVINVFSPINDTFTISTIFFNATSNKTINTWIVNYNGTNVTLSSINTTLEVEDGNNFNLKLYANNSATGVFGLNDTIFFSVDSNDPSLNVTEPFGVINFQDISENQTLRFNVSDINLDVCTLQYEETNTTVDCSTNITNFTIGTDRTLTFFANDTLGNLASQVVTWSYLVLQTSTTFNSSDHETASQRFAVNVTTNGSVITAGSLTFDGTENTGATITNPTGNNYSITKSITIPASIGTKTHNFNLTIISKIINTTAQTMVINATNFTICQASPLNIPYINITFKNETLSEEIINATISSTWTYSLSALSGVNKTLTFSEATQKLNYTFCADPSDRNLNIDLTMTYNNDISQQRSFTLTTTLSSVLLTQILFLLPTTDGLFSPFKTITVNGDTITNVKAVITRIIGGSTITITSGFTDGSGFITFFLDPDETYSVTFTKIPFQQNSFSFTPTAALRNVIMGGEISAIGNGTEITRGLTWQIIPKNFTLANNTDVTFEFRVNKSDNSITFMSMNITNATNGVLLFLSQSSNGTLSGVLNTGNNSKLFGSFVIKTASETISFDPVWNIYNLFLGDYSIFRQLTLTSENELISDFTRLIIVLFTMAAVMIFLTRKEITDTSESKLIVAMLLIWAFSLVGWLDTGIVSTTTSNELTILSQYSNQFGIAIITSIFATFFIFRRVFIGKT